MSLPSIQTVEITEYSLLGFTVKCNLTSLGGESVSDRGFVWHNTPNPTLDNWWVSQGSKTSTGEFEADYPGDTLQPDTTYYVRAFATNAEGTAYGDQLTFIVVANIPTVETVSIKDIVCGEAYEGMESSTDTPGFTAVIKISNLGDKKVTDCGVCFGTSPNPTVLGNKLSMGQKTTVGNKVSRCPTTILEDEVYYVRAYAENSKGLAYGKDISFGGVSLYEWVFVATPDHGQLEGLGDDDHEQYLTQGRHDTTDRHQLGTVVPHDIHSNLSGLGTDDHPQYLNNARHDLKSAHQLGTVVPYAEPVTNGDPDNPELIFDNNGDIVIGEVEF
jgi:hypothetical protein